MTGKKLKVDKVWSHMQGGGQEYLTLVYEKCYGAGLAYNQMQFIADEINDGRIVLPPPARDDRPISEITREMADIMEREKKYEFSVYPPEVNGVFQYRAGAELKAFMLKLAGYRDGTIVRRSVGEWEDAK